MYLRLAKDGAPVSTGRSTNQAAEARISMLDPDQRPADRQSLTDEELMLRVQAGEKACFDLLVQRYKTRLFNYLLRLVRDADLAEELAQDAFVRAYVNADKYRTIARFSTWLYTIATNLVRNRYRQKKRRPQMLSLFFRTGDGDEEMVQDIADQSPDPEEQAVGQDLQSLGPVLRLQNPVSELVQYAGHDIPISLFVVGDEDGSPQAVCVVFSQTVTRVFAVLPLFIIRCFRKVRKARKVICLGERQNNGTTLKTIDYFAKMYRSVGTNR